MFYSQFILAKKGPLGTIWIAAHLERKLRKNQVADTDIGVSVDSILFPDAPIALRLSSHLLLGVVRIYSKKVNYLFNDCSEALIKIKHAFRSTAVDLPPEESTAPYHSITLPENFDLDNFELPDSAFLDGNFVDHHVSAREQITLQDTRNDAAFPTSKFGLDERFGDEDPSQIGLELDEELFIEKKVSPKHDEDSLNSKVSGSHHGETSVPSTSVAVDVQFGCNEEKYNEIPNELSELLSNNYDKNFFSGSENFRRDANSSHRHGYTIQTPDLNETIQPEGPTALSPYIPFSPNDVQTLCLVEPAQEPSTPALLEVVPSHFQEVPALSPQEKDEAHVELGRLGTCTSPSMEIECSNAGNKTIHASAELAHKFEEDAQRLPLPSTLISLMPESVTPTYSNHNSTPDNVRVVSEAECQQIALVGCEINNVSAADHRIENEVATEPSAFSHEAMTLISPPKLAAHFRLEPATTNTCTQSMDVSGDIFTVEQTPFKGSTEPTETANLNHVKDGDSFRSTSMVGSDFLIRSCGSNLHLPSSTFVQTAPFEAELTTSSIHTDNFDVSGVNLDLKRTCRNEPTEISNLGCGEDNDSCLFTSVVGSDFLSRSRVSNVHPPSSFFVDGALGDASELSLRDYCFSQKTPTREEVQQINRSSFEVQGEDLHYSNGQFINLEEQHMSGYTPSDFKYGARKSNELSMNVVSKLSHLDNEKYPSSSEFLEPEKMLAPNFVVDFPSYQVLQATDKGSTQSDGIFDRNDSQFSRKRRLMDSAILQTSTSAELSVLPRSKRSTEYIPSDNDALTSILDGRTTPWLKTSSIPSLSKVSSQKRPRPMSKVGMPRRRKVLVDDAMVLHADVIRQQLTNTEDIRRMRKKAPCTRPEIWKIYIDAMEYDTFDRSILTGLSVELNILCNLKNDAQKDLSSSIEELNSQVKTSGDRGSSRALPIKEMADKEMNERMLSFQSTFNMNNGPSNIASASVQTRQADVQINPYNQLQNLPVQPQVRPFRNDQAFVMGSSGGLANPNEMGDKEMNERILPFHSIPNRNDGLSNITTSATLRTLEAGAQSNLHDHLQKLPVHSPVGPFNNNQASAIGSSTVSQLRNEINDNEMNERILSVHEKDDPSSTRAPNTVQTHEVSAQYDLYDHLQKLSVQPQVEQFNNHQASVTCAMQPDTENFSTSSTQKTPIPEVGQSTSLVETRSIIQADEYDTEAKTSKGIESSMFLEFSSDMVDKEINQRISSVLNIVNKNAGSSNISVSDTVRIHEAGPHCDLYGQLNKLSVQPQVGSFRNNQVSIEMHPDAGTSPNSIIQEIHNTEIDRSVSSVEKYADKSSNLPEGYNSQVKAHEGTGTSRLLEFPEEIGDKEMNERIVSAPVIVSMPSATVHSNVDSAQRDTHEQLENPPIQFELWPFSSDQGSLTCVTQPYAETQANSAILETPNHEINKSLPSVEELTDKSINLSERSLHNNVSNPLNTLNDGSSYSECATLVRVDGDIEVEDLTSESLVRTENICTAEGAVNMEEITDTVVVVKQSAVLVGTGGSVEALGDKGKPVIGTGGSVEALRDEGRPVSNVTFAEQNITFLPRSVNPDPSAMGKNNGVQDCNIESGMDVDMPLDVSAVKNTSDFCSAIDDNYPVSHLPGFLNEDDDENATLNEAKEGEPSSEDAQSLENSGWSTRTRGVARYLKNLFDEETGQGRKSIAVDRLLAGKTRKEASRMFFETLVLKTRDYIQVEQEKPFESINIMPRIKLLKSEF